MAFHGTDRDQSGNRDYAEGLGEVKGGEEKEVNKGETDCNHWRLDVRRRQTHTWQRLVPLFVVERLSVRGCNWNVIESLHDVFASFTGHVMLRTLFLFGIPPSVSRVLPVSCCRLLCDDCVQWH